MTHTCPMCNHRFTDEDGAKSCANCALFGAGGCQKMRCPHCGYEMPAPARLPGLIKKVVAKLTGKKSA
jgi:hypothetical protein